jgi:hypothetical protein
MKKRKFLTAEELLNLPESRVRLENYGDEYLIQRKIKLDLAKTRNYKPNFFFHATGGIGEAGVGEGLYLGKDKRALRNFYNSAGQEGKIIKYYGKPRFLNLALYSDYDEFEKEAIRRFGRRKNNEHMKLLTLEEGYDGIRYYDPIATGEEFVLFKVNKVAQV